MSLDRLKLEVERKYSHVYDSYDHFQIKVYFENDCNRESLLSFLSRKSYDFTMKSGEISFSTYKPDVLISILKKVLKYGRVEFQGRTYWGHFKQVLKKPFHPSFKNVRPLGYYISEKEIYVIENNIVCLLGVEDIHYQEMDFAVRWQMPISAYREMIEANGFEDSPANIGRYLYELGKSPSEIAKGNWK